jgi:hypothetical protein
MNHATLLRGVPPEIGTTSCLFPEQYCPKRPDADLSDAFLMHDSLSGNFGTPVTNTAAVTGV